jgi:beta-galactosidase/beta-glucuronidase
MATVLGSPYRHDGGCRIVSAGVVRSTVAAEQTRVRVLIYVPIVHSEADMGSLLEDVRRGFEEAYGEDAWKRRSAAVEAMWSGLAERLAAMPLIWDHVRLYQDGLPVCGREMDIVRDVAAAGSRNHQLLLNLIARGAILMGTEDAQLMVREYRRNQALVLATMEEVPESRLKELQAEGDAILVARDTYIAHRIEETLRKGETGIAFLGMLHRVNERIADGIEVQQLIHNLPFGSGKYQKERKI